MAEPTSPSDAPAPEEVPEHLREFGHFRLSKVLGRGAQGVVYLAEDLLLHRKVALKMLEGNNASLKVVRERFQREATVASRLDHPGICGVHEIGEVEGVQFIAMQFVRGTTLADMITDAQSASGGGAATAADDVSASITSLTGKDALQDVLKMLERCARALHAAHEAGLVHRDVKPGNIMVTTEGQPVLLDFGLARDDEALGEALTETGQLLGTPAYMAPEQLRGQNDLVDRRTDIYALGVTLFECLTLERPFAATTFEGLFNEILQGHAQNPRKLNPRIPRDLATIVEVAMDTDPERRYPTSLALAEDIRRVRSFEPIEARAAGTATRVRKWARRNSGAAVAIVAVVLLVAVGLGSWVWSGVQRRADAVNQFAAADSRLASGNLDGALVAIGRARDLGGDLLRALELETAVAEARDEQETAARRAEDLEDASQARQEARSLRARYEEQVAANAELGAQLERERGAFFAGFVPSEVRTDFAAQEEKLERGALAAEEALAKVREALDRARRLESPWGVTDATMADLASFSMSLWRTAVADGDAIRESILRGVVQSHDTQRVFERELVGRGTLTVLVHPSEAEVHLFRYEPDGRRRSRPVVPRLVPFPTSGVGRVGAGTWGDGFGPGDPCLVVTAVEPGSEAERAGIAVHDLIVEVAGGPALGGVLVAGPAEDHVPNEPVEAATDLRVESLNGRPVPSVFHWERLPPAADGAVDELVLADRDEPLSLSRSALRVEDALQRLTHGTRLLPIELTCVTDGRARTVELPAGGPVGLRCEPTAYPLITSLANRIETGAPLAVDPGSYLLLARGPGREDQRLPFVVERLGEHRIELELVVAGTFPPGFVRVPAGAVPMGGDPLAVRAGPMARVHVAEFYMARSEVTNAQWDVFLADPDVQRRMEESAVPIYVPREMSGPMPRANLGGPMAPVMGISWFDARDYVAWRNERARANGEPWEYALPTEQEWEKAARGADGRAFPWGDRFDFELVVGLFHDALPYYDAPGGLEPRDESPFGVVDMGGHRREWTADVRDPGDGDVPPTYWHRGGSWRDLREESFRAATRDFLVADAATAPLGLRLVARPRR